MERSAEIKVGPIGTFFPYSCFFIFREIKWVIISLLTSSYAIIVIFGILGLSQIEVTAISSNFSALIFILSISMNIHIINYYRLLEYTEKNLWVTLKNMFWPCLYTTLTTMVAFGSLIITDIKPIIDFGFIMLISLIISLLCSFTILPLCISLFSNNSNHKVNKTVPAAGDKGSGGTRKSKSNIFPGLAIAIIIARKALAPSSDGDAKPLETLLLLIHSLLAP